MKLTLHTLLFTAAAVIVAALLLTLAIDPGYTLDQRYGESSVVWRADRLIVPAVGGCITVEWRVDRIAAVYLNDVPTVGSGSSLHCTTGRALPVLRVSFPDGSERTFSVPVRYWVEQVPTIAGFAAALVLAIGGVMVMLTARLTGGHGTTRTAGRLTRALAAIGLVTLVLLVGLVALEFGARLAIAQFGTDDQKVRYLYTRAQINSESPMTTLPLPGVDYVFSPFRTGNNNVGYRGADVTLPKPDGVFRIIVMGASEVYGFTPPAETFPAQLERLLREQYGYDQVEVINGGIIGYTSWQVTANFSLHAVELDPDLAIVYIGGNDATRREIAPDCYRGANALIGIDPAARISTDDGFEALPISTLYRLIAIPLGWMDDPTDFSTRSLTVDVGCDRDSGSPAANTAANPPIYFERNLRHLLAIADLHAIPVVLSSYAYLETPDPVRDAANPANAPHWRAAVAEHNAIVAALAETGGVPYLDYAAIAPQTPETWSDPVHPNSAGAAAQAEAFAAFLDTNGLIR